MTGEKMQKKKYTSRGSAIGRNVSKINGKLILLFKKKESCDYLNHHIVRNNMTQFNFYFRCKH